MDDDVAALWDETTRPSLDEADDTAYSSAQEAYHRHLVEIHDHLRSELTRLHGLVEEVRRGVLTAAEARPEVHAMSLRQRTPPARGHQCVPPPTARGARCLTRPRPALGGARRHPPPARRRRPGAGRARAGRRRGSARSRRGVAAGPGRP